MRYQNVDTVSFTDAVGVTRAVKEMRELPAVQVAGKVDWPQGGFMDEIASRNNIWGENAEAQSYRLHAANMVAIIEGGFLYDLRAVVIPAWQ